MLMEAFRNFMVKRTISAKLRNQGMNTFSNLDLLNEVRLKAEKKRQEENRPHEVLYFHKVDDPYSHLTIQYIEKLKSSFDIILTPVLVGEEDPKSIHEPSLYSVYCLEDAKRIAPFYGIELPPVTFPFSSRPSSVYQNICPNPVASGPNAGLTPSGNKPLGKELSFSRIRLLLQ